MRVTSCCGVPPIEPAPIVTTTSPSRAMPRSVAGRSAMSSTKTGSTLPATRTRARQRAAVGRDDRRLARRIDLGQHQRIDRRQHAHEILEQVARARIAMRLEREHQPAAGKARAHRGQRRGHLDRMVAVVVDQRVRAAAVEPHVAVALEAAADAVEVGERRGDRRVADADFAADRDRGQRVAHVVHAGQRELDRRGPVALGARDEAHAAAQVDDRRSRAGRRPRPGRR